jgi:hypothetical protein
VAEQLVLSMKTADARVRQRLRRALAARPSGLLSLAVRDVGQSMS